MRPSAVGSAGLDNDDSDDSDSDGSDDCDFDYYDG